jgi:hypothetical protein
MTLHVNSSTSERIENSTRTPTIISYAGSPLLRSPYPEESCSLVMMTIIAMSGILSRERGLGYSLDMIIGLVVWGCQEMVLRCVRVVGIIY